MDCCQCQGIETKFDQKYAAKKLKQYRKDGPKKTTLQLIEALQVEDSQGLELIDIGGGVGDIQHALLSNGVRSAINIEASSAYLRACQEEAERQGHAEQITHFQGNFVDLAGDIPSADIATLDRVICCYDDMVQLVELSAQKAKRLYGVVYPRDKWWVKLGNLLYYNLRNWLQRSPLRNFVHPTKAVEDVIQKNGLERCFYREMGPWQVVVFSRQ
jgi:magnesium-protoporphyrin O-methyltransferase